MSNMKCFKNGVPIYSGKPVDFATMDINEGFKIIDENFSQLQQIDKLAKSKGELLGRYVDIPVADGKAIYQIIRVNKNTVRVRLLTGLGDDYAFDYWGYESLVDKEYVASLVRSRDKLDELFGRK